MRTSYSALTTYQQCPLRFKFQEIDRIRVPKNVEAVFGNIIHACLKFMFSRSPLYPTLDEVIDYFRNLWQAKTDLEIKPEEDKAYGEDGISILKNFYRLNQPWNFNVLDLESKFEILIADPASGENHILAGKIDRVDKLTNEDAYEIIDYKTSRRMPSQENLDKDLQMAIYHLGLSKRWPHIKPEKIKLSLYFLKHGEKISTSRSQTQTDLENTKNLVLETIREIKGRIEKNYDFPAYPTVLCDWCGYKPMCPMWRHLYESRLKPDSHQIKAFIDEYFTLKAQNQQNNRRISALQAQICEFMGQEGVDRVFSENGYLTRILQERLAYDMVKIKQILEELGRWNEVVKKKQFTILKATKKKINKQI